MSSIQLSFSLRVSSGVKTVHLMGSWDNYDGQLPLARDKTSSKSGAWKGTFRFQNSTLEPGQRYWYYYIIDGYHTSHNPSEPSTVEPTTGRELNVLDVPRSSKSSSSGGGHHSKPPSSSANKTSSSSRHSSSSHSSSRDRPSRQPPRLDIPKGRPLSVSQIKAPKPTSPHATRHILDHDYDLDALADRFAATGMDEYEYGDDVITEFSSSSGSSSNSPLSSSGSDPPYYRSDNSSPGSSGSGYSTPNSDCSSCTCERYGITRKGERVRLDCGGTRCGYDENCSSSSDDDARRHTSRSARRNGIVMR